MADIELDESLIDGVEPELNLEPDGRVSVKGEEIPDSAKVIEDSPVDEPAPKAEEPEEAPAPESTGEEFIVSEDDLAALKSFANDERLTKRYGTVGGMVDGRKDTDKYVTDLEGQRNYYKGKYEELQATPEKVEPEAKAPSEEDFYKDPVGIITKIIDGRMGNYDKKLENIEYKNFVSSKSDFKTMEPFMTAQLEQNPGLSQLGYDSLPILYQLAKAAQLSQATAAAPKKPVAPAPDKSHAETSVGKKGNVLSKDNPEHWKDMTLKEMEAELGYVPET